MWRGYVRWTVLAERKGSITVTALVGTGLVTLGVALTGMAGISSDLQAANRAAPSTPVPLLTPSDEVADPNATAEATKRRNTDCEHWRQSRRDATGTSHHRET